VYLACVELPERGIVRHTVRTKAEIVHSTIRLLGMGSVLSAARRDDTGNVLA